MDSSLIVLIILATALLLMLAAVARFSRPRLNKHHFEKQWEKIKQQQNYPMAVLKADSLVDEALRHAGVRGENMGQRLNKSAGLLRDINGVWSAHKLRNKIAHESDITPSDNDCQRALRQFEKALKDLGAL